MQRALTREFPAGVSYIGVEELGNNATIVPYRLEATFLNDLGNEAEPNGSNGTATVTPGTSFVISGDHELFSDKDVFRISVPTGASVRAEIIEGNGNLVETCEAASGVDSRLSFSSHSTGLLHAEDDDDGRGVCSLIDGTGPPPISTVGPLDYGASALTGDYYLTVRGFSDTDNAPNVFDYRLAVIVE